MTPVAEPAKRFSSVADATTFYPSAWSGRPGHLPRWRLWRETKDMPYHQATTMKTEMEYLNLLLGDGTSIVVPTHSERSDLYTSTAAQQKQLRTQYHQIHAQAQVWCVDD